MKRILSGVVALVTLAGVVWMATRGSLSPELRQMIGVMHRHNDRSARTCSEIWVNHQGVRKEVNACVARFRQVYPRGDEVYWCARPDDLVIYNNQPTNWAYANGLSETMVVDWAAHSTMQTLFARYPCVVVSPAEERVYETVFLSVEEFNTVGQRELALQPVPIGVWGVLILLLAMGLLGLTRRRRFA